MKKGTYAFIEETLNDYDKVDQYISRRIEELKYPVAIIDENIGGSRSGGISNPTERLAVTIMDDMLINNLRNIKKVVDEVLDTLEPNARSVIELYYMQHPRKYTWSGVANETKYSEKNCRTIRNKVFDEIAKKLGMPL